MGQISFRSQDAIIQRLREGGEEAVRRSCNLYRRNRSGGMEAVERGSARHSLNCRVRRRMSSSYR